MARSDSYPTGWFVGHLSHKPSREECRRDEILRDERSDRAARARAAVRRRTLTAA